MGTSRRRPVAITCQYLPCYVQEAHQLRNSERVVISCHCDIAKALATIGSAFPLSASTFQLPASAPTQPRLPGPARRTTPFDVVSHFISLACAMTNLAQGHKTGNRVVTESKTRHPNRLQLEWAARQDLRNVPSKVAKQLRLS